MRAPGRLAGIAAAAATVALALVASSALAAPKTYRPNKTGDHQPNGCTHHDCTLREAVIKANNHNGKDTILLKRRTYNLHIARVSDGDPTSGDLNITEPVVIKHKGRGRATIDANGIDRVINQVTSDTDHYTNLVKLVIRGGDTSADGDGWGGGVEVGFGLLGLTKSVVSGNHSKYDGGGLYSGGGSSELTVKRSVVKGNDANFGAGGIYLGGMEGEISRSTVKGNHAGSYGGGVYNSFAITTISRSTIANNHGGNNGGGIANFNELTITGSTISGNQVPSGALGGGIANSGADASTRMVNDTVANNRSGKGGGGIYNAGQGLVRMNAVTVARNRGDTDEQGFAGGGLYEESLAVYRIKNSLIALNHTSMGAGPNCSDQDPNGIVSQGHNLVADNGGCDGFSSANKAPSDRVNVSPRIRGLRHNGGPTKTIALRKHSKAINHAGSSAPGRDQRGHKRHNPDIGAFER